MRKNTVYFHSIISHCAVKSINSVASVLQNRRTFSWKKSVVTSKSIATVVPRTRLISSMDRFLTVACREKEWEGAHQQMNLRGSRFKNVKRRRFVIQYVALYQKMSA